MEANEHNEKQYLQTRKTNSRKERKTHKLGQRMKKNREPSGIL